MLIAELTIECAPHNQLLSVLSLSLALVGVHTVHRIPFLSLSLSLSLSHARARAPSLTLSLFPSLARYECNTCSSTR